MVVSILSVIITLVAWAVLKTSQISCDDTFKALATVCGGSGAE